MIACRAGSANQTVRHGQPPRAQRAASRAWRRRRGSPGGGRRRSATWTSSSSGNRATASASPGSSPTAVTSVTSCSSRSPSTSAARRTGIAPLPSTSGAIGVTRSTLIAIAASAISPSGGARREHLAVGLLETGDDRPGGEVLGPLLRGPAVLLSTGRIANQLLHRVGEGPDVPLRDQDARGVADHVDVAAEGRADH